MAFTIELGLTQSSYDKTTHTSTVLITYTFNWTGGTWNWEGRAQAGVTVNGTSAGTFYPILNPSPKTVSGSKQVWSKTMDIDHGSDTEKTVEVSAYFNWRNATASKSFVLKSDGTGTSSSSSMMATIDKLAVQTGTERTMYATWTWDQDNTENYEVEWYYATGDGIWFIGTDTTVDRKQSTYTPPENATKVKIQVKPISKKHTVNDTETSYWTAKWSTAKTYDLSDAPPLKPPVPTVTIKDSEDTMERDEDSDSSSDGSSYETTEVPDDVLYASLENLDVNADQIQFQVVKDNKTVFSTGTASIITSSAEYSCKVDKSSRYKVRCRSCRGSEYSEWSEYSSNVTSSPAAPSEITACRAADFDNTSGYSVYLEWAAVTGITTYDIEYTTNKDFFNSSNATTVTSGIEATHYTFTSLSSDGGEYFFRVRAVDDQVHSAWSGIKSVVIGEPPAAPTTWSSTTVASIGDTVNLYWIHNSEDGSAETYADVKLKCTTNGVETIEQDIVAKSTDEDEKYKTSIYSIDTTNFSSDTTIVWSIRTAGVTLEYGDWSVERTIEVYAKPTLEIGIADANGDLVDTLTSFPFAVNGVAGPSTQSPVSYHVSVTSGDSYETVDEVGNVKMVNRGDTVYSKHFDAAYIRGEFEESLGDLNLEFSANNIDLENNVTYTVTCTVYMDSGLEATSSYDLLVSWTDVAYEPNAEIGVDTESYTAYIRPYCIDQNNAPVEDILLSVYRREFDGTFTEIAKNLDNTRNTFVTDPHPALDFARYRIVATTKTTGAVSYYDVPGYPVGGKAVVIQWNEAWSNFDIVEENAQAEPAWTGSMLKLPYNIDVSDSNSADVSLIEYIGRKYPVSYYGTQLGTSSSWNVAIEKSDKETLYALRRLAAWMGDVYVREPSASGYWAKIAVSFSQKHKELTIPVTLDIVRVEGGV